MRDKINFTLNLNDSLEFRKIMQSRIEDIERLLSQHFINLEDVQLEVGYLNSAVDEYLTEFINK